MFDRLGRLVSRRAAWVILGWVALVLAIWAAAPRWDDVTRDGDFAYLPSAMTSVQGQRLLEEAFPHLLSKSQVILVVARGDGPLGSEDLAVADRLVEAFQPEEDEESVEEGMATASQPSAPPDGTPPIVGVLSHRTEVVGEKLVSRPGVNGQALLIVLQLRSEFMAVGNMPWIAAIRDALDRLREDPRFPPGLELGLTGSAAIGGDMLLAAEESIRNTERMTIFLVVVILLVVYRAPGLVIVPVATIFASLAVATGLVASLAQLSAELGWLDFKIFKTTKIFVVVILFGAGTDFCLFLIARYKEELERGLEAGDAIALALGRVGEALAASAMTTILGLGAMAFADFGKFRNSGPAIALCLLVALAASVTLAPAVLRLAGRAVFWPFCQRLGAADRSPRGLRFWERLGRAILARPGLILTGSLLAMAPLVWRGAQVEVTYDLLSELPPDRPSVQGTRLLRRYFPAGETGPITILAYDPRGPFEANPQTREKIARLAQELHRLEYVDSQGSTVRPVMSVRSLAEPLGEAGGRFGLYGGLRKGILRGHPRTRSTYLAAAPEYQGKVTRLDLVALPDPFSLDSIRLLDHLDQKLETLAADPRSEWYGTEFLFLGTTAGIRDLRLVTTSDLGRLQRLVPLAVLMVLVLVLRRPVVSLYLVLSVLLGYYVTIGATELIFARLYGDSFVGLDWKAPMFLFVILIAVGEDYNIYLATRVAEEQRRLGAAEGLHAALVRTGGIITSCGVIMAGTFASMTTGTLRAIQELGVALSLGVLLDTLVIRTVLVPAFLVLWDRRFPPRFGQPVAGTDAQLDTRPHAPNREEAQGAHRVA